MAGDYVSTNTAPSTAYGYSDIIRAHIIPELGRFPLTALQPSHIQAYYSRMLGYGRRDGKGGLSAQMVKHHHRVLYEALKHAVKHGVIIRNVVEAVDPPRPENKEMSTLEPDDVHPKVVSERLRHSLVAITLDTYSYVLPGIQAAAWRFDEGLHKTWEEVTAENVS